MGKSDSPILMFFAMLFKPVTRVSVSRLGAEHLSAGNKGIYLPYTILYLIHPFIEHLSVQSECHRRNSASLKLSM